MRARRYQPQESPEALDGALLPGAGHKAAPEPLRGLGAHAGGFPGQIAQGTQAVVELAAGQQHGGQRVHHVLAERQRNERAQQPDQKAQEQPERGRFDQPDAGGGNGDAGGDVAAGSSYGMNEGIATSDHGKLRQGVKKGQEG